MPQNEIHPPPRDLLPPPPSHSSDTSFPILAISILGILTTAILLLSYYIFVIKCCLNWHRSDVIRRLSRSRRHGLRRDDPTALYSFSAESRGLEESAIRAIPTFRFRGGGGEAKGSSFHECAVCLNEFQEEERIRLLPNCCHVFHIDCIDTWLQGNANCPLCRSDITTTTPIPAPHFMAQTIQEDIRRSGEDIVIEVREDGRDGRTEEWTIGHSKGRKMQHLGSMGDECIDVRVEDVRFSVQPMRRSFSMDSSNDRLLSLAVQEILQKKNPCFKEVDSGEGCSSSSSSNSSSSGVSGLARTRRQFFSFGRSSRSSVAPIEIEL